MVSDCDGNLSGIAAVIDKDFASALLAQSIGADLLLISTVVERVSLNFGESDQVDLPHMSVQQAKRYIEEGHFAPGSMLPKIQAIVWFLETGGGKAIITNPENIGRALRGESGTHIIA